MASDPQSPNHLLAALPAADYDLLRPDLRVIALAQGEVLAEAGAEFAAVYFPHSGAISRVLVLPEGEAIEVTLTGRETAIGAYVAANGGVPPWAAVVQYPGQATVIELRRFQRALARSPALAGLLMQHLWIDLLQAQQLCACNAAHPVTARVARRLLCLHDVTQSAEFPITQETMARLLGVRRNSVAQAIAELEGAGAVRVRRGEIAAVSLRGLTEFSCDCIRTMRQYRNRLNRAWTVLPFEQPAETP